MKNKQEQKVIEMIDRKRKPERIHRILGWRKESNNGTGKAG